MDLRSRYGPWAFVTGASSGLGECYARELGRLGFDLVLVARRLERLERLAADLRRECRVQAVPVRADLAEEAGLAAAIAASEGREPGLLVNNAGFSWTGPFLEQDEDSVRRMLRVNAEAPLRLARALLPAMLRARRGAMILVSSVAGHLPTPWIATYGASKACVQSWGESLAVELRGSGVDVLVHAPGHTRTEFHRTAGIDGATLGGSAKPEEVVRDALATLGRKETRVPGALNRVITLFPRLATRRFAAGMSGRLLERRLRRSRGSETG